MCSFWWQNIGCRPPTLLVFLPPASPLVDNNLFSIWHPGLTRHRKSAPSRSSVFSIQNWTWYHRPCGNSTIRTTLASSNVLSLPRASTTSSNSLSSSSSFTPPTLSSSSISSPGSAQVHEPYHKKTKGTEHTDTHLSTHRHLIRQELHGKSTVSTAMPVLFIIPERIYTIRKQH